MKEQAMPLAARVPMRRVRLWLFVLPVLACALLALAPQIDVEVESVFFAGDHFLADSEPGRLARDFGRVIPFLILFGLLLLWIVGKLGGASEGMPRGRSIAWLALSMLLGPGLLVDELKDISHRPRPVQVREFGGSEDFRPFFRFDGDCPRNCSFPSGEASAAFWTLAPASLAPPPLRPVAIAGALVFGFAVGGLRMAVGAHFLSDVVFATILTIMVAFALRRWALPPVRSDIAGTSRPRD